MSIAIPEGYKTSPLGVIPIDWDVKTLDELGELKNGINKDKEQFGHGYPFVNLMDVFGISKIFGKYYSLVNTTDNERRDFNLRKGDVLFVRSSVKPEGVGLTSLVCEEGLNVTYSGFLIRFRSNQKLDFEFKGHCFLESTFRQRLLNKSTISANTNINQVALKSLKLALPPLREQKVIAAVLSLMDDNINKTNQLISKKESQKKAFMQQLLAGKKRLKGFDGEWKEIRLAEIGKIVSGGTPSTTNEEYWNGGINWCTPTDITNLKGETYIGETVKKITEKGYKNSSATLLPINSVIVCTRATIGACAINKFPITTNQGFKSIIPKSINYLFLYYKLLTIKKDLISMANGSTFLEISKSDFEDISFKIPALDEQAAIAQVLQTADKEIQVLKAKANKLKAQKRGMMQALLTGKKRLKTREI